MQAEFLLKTEKSSDLTVTEIKNRSYRLHFHSNIELILVLDGELEVWINNRRKLLRKGEISVAWSYDAHGYATPLHSVSLSVIIPPRYYSEFLPLFNNRHTNDPFLSDPRLFEQIHSWARSAKNCEDELTRKGFIYIILGTVLKNMSFETDECQTDRPLLSDILIYLNDHFREDLSLASVARALCYHPNYISNIFKSTLHIGFKQYLTLLRLREAVILLQSGEKSITEAAFESGFQSLRTFYRVFREEFKCAPREFMASKQVNS